MERYDYRAAITEDIISYIAEDFEPNALTASDLLDEWREYTFDLSDRLWCEDSVTGNGSGSYWFNAWKAEEAICHNLDIYRECLDEWGGKPTTDAEHIDVTIRCYLLDECICAVDSAISDHLEWAAEVAEESDGLTQSCILADAIRMAGKLA